MQLKLSRYCCSVTFVCIVKPCSHVPFERTANVKYERSFILLVNAYSKKLDSAIEFSQLSLSVVGTIIFNFVALTNSI